MSFRAVILGLLVGSVISAISLFNDIVIRQSFLVSNQLPAIVIGTLILLVLLANPVLHRLRPAWALRPLELGVITALALVACTWPSFSFFRGFVANTAIPWHIEDTRPHWQSAHVMSFVPGGSPLIAPGQVRDWERLAERLLASEQAGESAPLSPFWERLGEADRGLVRELAETGRATPIEHDRVRAALNRSLTQITIDEWRDALAATPDRSPELQALLETAAPAATSLARARRNRSLLVAAADEAVLPSVAGGGLLLPARADETPAISDLVLGQPGDGPPRIPWDAWWPTLLFWSPVALLLAAASLCLAAVVHQQWSRHELLSYPIARLVRELSEREPHRGLPTIAQHKPFWFALGAVFLLHMLNGLHAWFPSLPHIPLQLDFRGLGELFPSAARVYGSHGVFWPKLSLTAIAFTFFLSSTISFSLGLSNLAYVVVGALLLQQGISMEYDYIGAPEGNMMRLGGFLAMALAIAYSGRRYYWGIVRRSVALPSLEQTPTYAVWSARLFVLAVLLLVVAFLQIGLSPGLAVVLVLLLMVMVAVLARIVAETGLFFVQAGWAPVGVLTGLLGFEMIGPTSYIIMGLASITLVGDPRTTLMPYAVNALQIVDRRRQQPRTADQKERNSPAAALPWLTTMVVLGFIISGVAALAIQYRYGVGGLGVWSRQDLPALPFESLAHAIADAESRGTIAASVQTTGLDRLNLFEPDVEVWGWMMCGFAVVIGTAAARLRLPWWPIHPVLFLVWGTYAMRILAMSFLLGWALKTAAVQLGGARAHAAAMPIAVGVIAGEVLAAFAWLGIGSAYYFAMGQNPVTYSIFP